MVHVFFSSDLVTGNLACWHHLLDHLDPLASGTAATSDPASRGGLIGFRLVKEFIYSR